MKIAVLGSEIKSSEAVRLRGKKLGYDVETSMMHPSTYEQGLDKIHSEAIEKADAVLLLLHDDFHLFHSLSTKLLDQVTLLMRKHSIHRLLLSSVLPIESGQLDETLPSGLNAVKHSGLDWTVITHQHGAEGQADMVAKAIVGQITDSGNIGSILLLPTL